jgi:hypothetical protein
MATAQLTTSALPALDFKPCDCQAKLPSRACRFCLDFRWLKRCPDCTGIGLLYKPARAGAQPRGERCGRCAGLGWTPCPKKEIPQAEAEVRALLAAEAGEAEEELTFVLPPVPGSPSQTVVARTKKSRRAQIRRSQAKPQRKTLGQPDIRAERPQNPLEAVALFEPRDNSADPLAAETATEAQEAIPAQAVAPGSFAPDDLPPGLPPSLPPA